MTDYYFYSKKIGPGQTIAFEIELRESSLSDNQITSVSDISEIEFCLEIKENYKTIDTPTIVINN